MTDSNSAQRPTRDEFALPLVVAVTGHRDLLPSEISTIRDRAERFFSDLRTTYPDRPLIVLSSLAEGADQLVAQLAVDLGIALHVPLPMPLALYRSDFESAESVAAFDELLARADKVYELPIQNGADQDQVARAGSARDHQYAQLGVYICAHCHILLALWDGKPGTETGGTGQVVKFHHDDIMPGYATDAASRRSLVDDESDLVFHIVCSRDRSDGEPEVGLKPQDCSWFTKDSITPRSRDLPTQHARVFARSAEFNEDAIRNAAEIERERDSLLRDSGDEALPDALRDIDRMFGVADWLALRYQRRYLSVLRITHVLAFVMGLMFLLYTDLEPLSAFVATYLMAFAGAAAAQQLAKSRSWHRKYLDYRALAEGLRVQFYWAAADVRSANAARFTHDAFLQTQDPEVGWIRNVMRVSSAECDAHPIPSASGLEFTVRNWVGNQEQGQLGYYRHKSLRWLRRRRFTDGLGRSSLLVCAALVVTLVAGGTGLGETTQTALILSMGTTLLLFGVRHAYAYGTAEKELIKQYESMVRIFDNARRRLDSTHTDAARRKILKALGRSALDEHAAWLLMHRERSIDQGELWRMGGGGG